MTFEGVRKPVNLFKIFRHLNHALRHLNDALRQPFPTDELIKHSFCVWTSHLLIYETERVLPHTGVKRNSNGS